MSQAVFEVWQAWALSPVLYMGYLESNTDNLVSPTRHFVIAVELARLLSILSKGM